MTNPQERVLTREALANVIENQAKTIEEQLLTIKALNSALGGEGTLTTDNLVRIGRLEENIAQLQADRSELEYTCMNRLHENENLKELLARYRNETPLGYQPSMIPSSSIWRAARRRRRTVARPSRTTPLARTRRQTPARHRCAFRGRRFRTNTTPSLPCSAVPDDVAADAGTARRQSDRRSRWA